MGMRQARMVVEGADDPPPVDKIVLCNEDMLTTLATWNVAFARDCLGTVEEPPSVEECRESISKIISRGDLYLWVVDGKGIVAMAAEGRRLLDVGCSVSLVYTPPEHRGNGYAAALLSVMCTRLRERGNRVFLLADMNSNFGTVRLYERIGFCNDGAFGDIRFSHTEREQ